MKIYVRRRHIEEGARREAKTCPVALAAKECMDHDLYVLCRHIHWRNGKMLMLPRSAQRFIKRFDSGKPVKPFAFTIRA